MTDSTTDYAMAPVRASSRVSIAWSGAPPEEDTDTLVLTIDGISLDLRVFISGPDKGKIDWASVGAVREVESSGKWRRQIGRELSTEDGNLSLAWDLLIDSRNSDPEEAGSFSTLPNGDILEAGTMYNPNTGRSEPFEEVWRRHPRQTGWPYCVLQRVDGRWKQDTKDKAFLGCLGPKSLGLAQDGDAFKAYRDEDGKRLYEFDADESVLPPFHVDPSWKVGMEVVVGSGRWLVRAAGTLK